MPKIRSQRRSNLERSINKLLLSGFVLFSFVAYILHERSTPSDAGPNPAVSPPGPDSAPPDSGTLPSPAAGSLRNGIFKGPEVDAYYGLVQVQATIQNGKLTYVQFLEYPNDRRTSIEINTIAMPYLQQEALQVQTANVDIISGATLTSEAFRASLQSALDSAKN